MGDVELVLAGTAHRSVRGLEGPGLCAVVVLGLLLLFVLAAAVADQTQEAGSHQHNNTDDGQNQPPYLGSFSPAACSSRPYRAISRPVAHQTPLHYTAATRTGKLSIQEIAALASLTTHIVGTHATIGNAGSTH